MAVSSAQEALDAYLAAMASGTTSANYRKGISATTVNPMQLAAEPAALQRYQDGVAESVRSGKRARSLLAASAATWKNNALTVGASRLADGAKKASAKLMATYQRLQSVWAQMAAIGADKTRGWEDRMTSAVRLMKEAGGGA